MCRWLLKLQLGQSLYLEVWVVFFLSVVLPDVQSQAQVCRDFAVGFSRVAQVVLLKDLDKITTDDIAASPVRRKVRSSSELPVNEQAQRAWEIFVRDVKRPN